MSIVRDSRGDLVRSKPHAQPARRPGNIAPINRHRSSRDALGWGQAGYCRREGHHFEIGEQKAFESMRRVLDVVVAPRKGDMVGGIDGGAGPAYEESRAIICEDQSIIFQRLSD